MRRSTNLGSELFACAGDMLAQEEEERDRLEAELQGKETTIKQLMHQLRG